MIYKYFYRKQKSKKDDKMTLFKYIIHESPIDEITIIWRKKPQFQIEEIILSKPNKSSSEIAKEKYEQEEPLPINKK